MIPGISSYTFTWAIGVPGHMPEKPLDEITLIEKAFSYGIKVVQMADNLPLNRLDRSEIERLKLFADSLGINLEMGARGLTPKNTIDCLEIASMIESPILRMVIDASGFEPDLKTVISITKDLLPELKKRNIRLAVENHDRLKAREFERIVLGTDPEWVGICLDSVNSMGAGEGIETVTEILAQYTINLHVKDFTVTRLNHKMGFLINGTPAGKGMLNIPELISKINSCGRCRSAILELWTPPEDTLAKTIIREEKWALESIQYLKELFQ